MKRLIKHLLVGLFTLFVVACGGEDKKINDSIMEVVEEFYNQIYSSGLGKKYAEEVASAVLVDTYSKLHIRSHDKDFCLESTEKAMNQINENTRYYPSEFNGIDIDMYKEHGLNQELLLKKYCGNPNGLAVWISENVIPEWNNKYEKKITIENITLGTGTYGKSRQIEEKLLAKRKAHEERKKQAKLEKEQMAKESAEREKRNKKLREEKAARLRAEKQARKDKLKGVKPDAENIFAEAQFGENEEIYHAFGYPIPASAYPHIRRVEDAKNANEAYFGKRKEKSREPYKRKKYERNDINNKDSVQIGISGNGEKCSVNYDGTTIKNNDCRSMVDSNGIEIYCTPNLKACKTYNEIENYISSSKVNSSKSLNDMQSYTLKGHGEECLVTADSSRIPVETNCLQSKNSKGQNILCTPRKTKCKTISEIKNSLHSIPSRQQTDTAKKQLKVKNLPSTSRPNLSKNKEKNNFLLADVDHDGKKERLQWELFSKHDFFNRYQLKLLDDDGKLLWEGARKKAPGQLIGEVGDFTLMPAVLNDIDGDGNVELVMWYQPNEPASSGVDIYRWDGEKFIKTINHHRDLVWIDAPYGKTLKWTLIDWNDYLKKQKIWWVSDLWQLQNSDLAMVKIQGVQYPENKTLRELSAKIRFTPTGAVIEELIE